MEWKHIRCIAVALLLLLLCCAPLYADFVSVSRFVDETDAILQWDSFRQQGLLWKDNNVIAFSPESNYIIYNYNQRIAVGDIEYSSDGQLLFNSDTYQVLKRLFAQSDSNSNARVAAIFIDAGHGGKDSGAVGNFMNENNKKEQIYEKDVVLRIAQGLSEQLKNAFPDKRIILSRSTDTFLSLQQRTKLSNAVRVQPGESILFISIHANASLNTKAAGYEVWYLPPDYRRNDLVDAQTVGVRDNDLLSILNSIKDEEYTIESVLLAQKILKGLDGSIGILSKNRGIKQELWFVVRQAKMPSVLVEAGFLSNPDEARRLSQDSYLHKVVNGIYNGVYSFVNDFE